MGRLNPINEARLNASVSREAGHLEDAEAGRPSGAKGGTMKSMADQFDASDRTPLAARIPGARRLAIIDSAATLFDRHGYHNTSMEDIAERVGLATPTLYHYFHSKDEILFEIHNAMIELILATHQERLAGSPGRWGEQLKGMVGDIIHLMESHPGHLRIFFEYHRELPESYKATIRSKRNRYRDQVRDVIVNGIESGEFRAVDPDLATLGVLGMANWTYQWLRPGGHYSADRITDVFYSFLIDGLALKRED
jgi:AcrR family transcriptional regulator